MTETKKAMAGMASLKTFSHNIFCHFYLFRIKNIISDCLILLFQLCGRSFSFYLKNKQLQTPETNAASKTLKNLVMTSISSEMVTRGQLRWINIYLVFSQVLNMLCALFSITSVLSYRDATTM